MGERLILSPVMLTAVGVWNLVECQVGIIAACAPPMKPALKNLFPRDSLVNLLDSIRDSISKGSRASSTSSRRPYARADSDGSPSFTEDKDHSVFSKVEIDHGLNSDVPHLATPDGIYVRRDLDYGSAERECERDVYKRWIVWHKGEVPER